MEKVKEFIKSNIVVIIFIVLCVIGINISKQSLSFVVKELVERLCRNSFLVLALIIPVIAGMGLNFGIVIGAMATQILIVFVVHWGVKGVLGILLCILLSTPLSIIFGYFTGNLLNKTKGQEMISSMILGFFANGLYQFFFLFMIGTIIPMNNPVLVISGGIGIKNTVDLVGNLKYALDGILRINMLDFITFGFILAAIVFLILFFVMKKRNKEFKKYLIYAISSIVLVAATFIPFIANIFIKTSIPIVTVIIIALICLFNVVILKTRFGQNLRTVGQNMKIANSSGLNVDKLRTLAIIISTVLAGWGQLIYLQNIGTLSTYGSHEQVGTFAIASLLVGGASVKKATNTQAIVGVILFHTLFIISPIAGKNLFGNAQIGEYFRVFIAYGVIGLSLGMHAWSSVKKKKITNEPPTDDAPIYLPPTTMPPSDLPPSEA